MREKFHKRVLLCPRVWNVLTEDILHYSEENNGIWTKGLIKMCWQAHSEGSDGSALELKFQFMECERDSFQLKTRFAPVMFYIISGLAGIDTQLPNSFVCVCVCVLE